MSNYKVSSISLVLEGFPFCFPVWMQSQQFSLIHLDTYILVSSTSMNKVLSAHRMLGEILSCFFEIKIMLKWSQNGLKWMENPKNFQGSAPRPRRGVAPGPHWGAYSAPQTPSCF